MPPVWGLDLVVGIQTAEAETIPASSAMGRVMVNVVAVMITSRRSRKKFRGDHIWDIRRNSRRTRQDITARAMMGVRRISFRMSLLNLEKRMITSERHLAQLESRDRSDSSA
jgi:hypothetical protein